MAHTVESNSLWTPGPVLNSKYRHGCPYTAKRQTFCVKTKIEDPTEFSGIQHISSDHVLLHSIRGLGNFSTLIAMEPLPMDLHST